MIYLNPCQEFPVHPRHFNFLVHIPASLILQARRILNYTSCNLFTFFSRKVAFKHLVSLSLDNYLAMDVACTLVCPKANQEVIITHPSGNETQKCEKCEGDCPKGGIFCVFVA